MKSMAYRDFVEQFLEANDWPSRKDGCPLGLLDQLSKEEKAEAETELIRRLSKGDDWPIRGLGHLRSIRALPRLKELLAETSGAIRACVALSIWKISKETSMVDIVIEESHNCYTDRDDHHNTFRMIDIVFYLAEFPVDAARNRLEELKSSKNYLISYNAKRAPQYWRQYEDE